MSESGGSLARDVEISIENAMLRRQDPIVRGHDSESDEEAPEVKKTIVGIDVCRAAIDAHKKLNFKKPLLAVYAGIPKEQFRPLIDTLKIVEHKHFAKIEEHVKRAICHASLGNQDIRWRADARGTCAITGVPATHTVSIVLDPIYTAVQWCVKNKKDSLILEKVEVVREITDFQVAKEAIKTVCALILAFSFTGVWNVQYAEGSAEDLAERFDQLYTLLMN